MRLTAAEWLVQAPTIKEKEHVDDKMPRNRNGLKIFQLITLMKSNSRHDVDRKPVKDFRTTMEPIYTFGKRLFKDMVH